MTLALPGATIGQRYGDKATVLAGLLMMLAGELLTTASTYWSLQIGGRLIGGTGGVLLNVLMTKMVADWFAGREIATAMAISSTRGQRVSPSLSCCCRQSGRRSGWPPWALPFRF